MITTMVAFVPLFSLYICTVIIGPITTFSIRRLVFSLCETYCSFPSYSVCLRATPATYFGGRNSKQVRRCPQFVALLVHFVC